MSEKLILSVDAPSCEHGQLKVQDVFQHLLDLFQLISESDPGRDEDIIWRLVSVSMNSPLTVTAEAVAARPGMHIDVDAIARHEKREFSRNYAALRSGVIPPAWQSGKKIKDLKIIMARNRIGIGVTNINLDIMGEDCSPIVVTPDDAVAVIQALDAEPSIGLGAPKSQNGSVEGRLVDITTHRGKPAIRLKERRTNADIICIIPEQFRNQIAENASIEDVWNGCRVVVRGIISYKENHSISHVEASDIRRVKGDLVPIERIQDKNFTAGLTAAEYLEKLREGTLG